MNVPKMRESYNDFLKFILDHVETGSSFNHPAPSDQGAYLEFYKDTVQQISVFWNWKAYWGVKEENNMFARIKVLHFHGIKPHDYVRKLLGLECDKAIVDLCAKYKQPIFRETIRRFLQAAASIPNFHENYCRSSFDLQSLQYECIWTLDALVNGDINVIRDTLIRSEQYRRHMHAADG